LATLRQELQEESQVRRKPNLPYMIVIAGLLLTVLWLALLVIAPFRALSA
jgi:hypothetical protein